MKPESLENGSDKPARSGNSKKSVHKKSPQKNAATIFSKSEKTNNKSYVGFSARSIRTIWEQHDCSMTEVSPEVVSKLAEDTSYKIWEIINNIKIYSKHSGGKVTVSLINDCLKESNVPPILGASTGQWNKVDLDGSYFFNSDEVVELRDVYCAHQTLSENGPVSLSYSWLLDERIGKDFNDLFNYICEAIFIGDDECFQAALRMVAISPHITGLLKHFFKKWIDLIAFDYNSEILHRSLHFLVALIQNPCTVNNDSNTELNYICQLLINLLLGPDNDDLMLNGHEDHMEGSIEGDQFHNSIKMTNTENFIPYWQQQSNYSNVEFCNDNASNIKQENSESATNNFNSMMMKEECEQLLLMVENQALNIKKEYSNNNIHGMDIKTELMDNYTDYNNFEVSNQLPQSVPDDINIEISETSSNDEKIQNNEEDFDEDLINFKLTTKKCEKQEEIDKVCHIIGLSASKWGGIERLMTYLIVNRVETFFLVNKKITSDKDFEFLQRAIRGLWCLGEFAFREFLIFFENIDTESPLCPENFFDYLNFAAIFLRGKNDIFFYEYLFDACGPKILPFMLYQSEYLLKLDKKRYKAFIKSKNSSLSYKYLQKVKVTSIDRRVDRSVKHSHIHVFEDHQKFIDQTNTKFRFRFPGCRPNTKLKKKKIVESSSTLTQNEGSLRKFNSKVVIAKRILFKPISNQIGYTPIINYHFLNL